MVDIGRFASNSVLAVLRDWNYILNAHPAAVKLCA
jgi:hypothetical protein